MVRARRRHRPGAPPRPRPRHPPPAGPPGPHGGRRADRRRGVRAAAGVRPRRAAPRRGWR
ncbi:isocitrate dehydrogenase, partial [Corynebacterium bovis]